MNARLEWGRKTGICQLGENDIGTHLMVQRIHYPADLATNV